MNLRPHARSVRLPWLVGLVLMLVFGLALAAQAPPRSAVSATVLAEQQSLVGELAGSAAADLAAIGARVGAAVGGLSAVPTQGELDRLREATGSTGVELAPAAGPGLRSGGAVPLPPADVVPPELYAAGGVLAVVVTLPGGSTLRASIPTAGLLPASAALVTSDGSPLLDPGAVTTTAAGLAVLRAAGPAVVQEGATAVAGAPLPAGAGMPGWSVLLTRSVEVPERDPLPSLVPGVLLLVLAVLAFSWMHRALVTPLLRLSAAAQRFSDGDLERPIPVGRLDEIGLTAQGLERARVLLVRREVRTERGSDR